MRVPFEEVVAGVSAALQAVGVPPERAGVSARLIAETDRDGVATHGVARVPRLLAAVRAGYIDPAAEPRVVTQAGALERWDGGRGVGNVGAHAAMARAMELAREFGLGGVGLGNASHWMRGGAFGWQAAEAGFAAICWTNTLPNLPPWGAKTAAVGNNPLVIAVPAGDGGTPLVLDMAMSQFSYGTLAKYRLAGEPLPAPGGYDEAGELTTDPAAIERTQRALPVGFWKGSGLAFALEVLGTMLAGGRATHEMGPDPLAEVGQSQVFLALDVSRTADAAEQGRVLREAAAALHAAEPVVAGRPARYPGEGTMRARAESARLGVEVPDAAWAEVVSG